jgi:hypothetical protein
MNRLAVIVALVVGLVVYAGQPTTQPAPSVHVLNHPSVKAEPVSHHRRSREVTREFQREHPCPSTGKRTGACPGYIKDHVVALCKGGPDAASNLQWQTVADAKAKDKWECK